MTTECAYITGGASGLGKAIATALAAKGIKVIIADRDTVGAETLAKKLNGYSTTVDVTSWQSQASAFQKAVEIFGRVDYVVANAGVGENQWMREHRENAGFEKPDLSVIEVNVTGTLYTASLAVQQFRRQGRNDHGFRGKVVITGSVCGIYCCPGLPIYTASKHAITGIVRSWGKALPAEGITLNSLNPNVLRTNLSTGQFYNSLDQEGLLTPISGVVETCERILDGAATASGECFEIGPNYAFGQGAFHPRFPELVDEKQKMVFDRLAERGHAKAG
ncbi:hypothetical protein BDV26DRAFT_293366 [Aspergillus bertholletiae]|uniref:NAD(P)-binding protein n=1 Tax=Aspergillus bertholletiae TaxID=1226010 RepID=A0A5N7B5I1_9EURO|nr:hypothetical protein BDV26DRAFT_293366 [Aspergillus bertholletiae]